MSKSEGNAIDPLVWMDRYGTDATRFTLLRGAHPGTDVSVSEDWAAGARAFCNKLWNATRFALLNGAVVGELPPAEELSAPDRWILSRLQATLAEADRRYEHFEFAQACEALYQFTWDEFCDWYVELAKGPLAPGGAAAERTRLILGHVLEVILRLLHPVVPFVTETVDRPDREESLVIAAWPTARRVAVRPRGRIGLGRDHASCHRGSSFPEPTRESNPGGG